MQHIALNQVKFIHVFLCAGAKLVVQEDKKAKDGKLDSTEVQDINKSDDKDMYSEERVETSFL